MGTDRDTDTQSGVGANLTIPTYDNNPILLRSFLLKLYPALSSKNANYDTAIKCGYIVIGKVTVVWSSEQAQLLANGTLSMETSPHSWEKPMPMATYGPTETELPDKLANGRFFINPEALRTIYR